jgi:hypothetical protein
VMCLGSYGEVGLRFVFTIFIEHHIIYTPSILNQYIYLL